MIEGIGEDTGWYLFYFYLIFVENLVTYDSEVLGINVLLVHPHFSNRFIMTHSNNGLAFIFKWINPCSVVATEMFQAKKKLQS